MTFLSGFIAIIGPPNVGKSTFLNRVLGEKVAIVTPKPQTTRNRIMGIFHGQDYQMVFVDTPGIHKTRTALHRSMVESALAAFHEVDILIIMMDMGRPDDLEHSPVMSGLKTIKKPCFLVINKIDKSPKETLLPLMSRFIQAFPFEAILPISALTGEGIPELLAELKPKLKSGPRFFPENMDTDRLSHSWSQKLFGKKSIFMSERNCPIHQPFPLLPWKISLKKT